MFAKTIIILFTFFAFFFLLVKGKTQPYDKTSHMSTNREEGRRSFQENHPPEVKIVAPVMNGSYQWDAAIPYTIKVTDQEDGESQYDEIPANEVFLEVRSLKYSPKPAASLRSLLEKEPEGLSLIKSSNCLNCHTQKSRLIGPSFSDIGKKYGYSPSALSLLSKRILEGSKGVWGNVVMPTHPELTTKETALMVKWILQQSKESDFDFYKGTEGSFRLKKPANPSQNTFLIIASYTDHGLKDKKSKKLTGQDAILVTGK